MPWKQRTIPVLTRMKFGSLVALEERKISNPSRGYTYLCRCDCGKECIATNFGLWNGSRVSCGCKSKAHIIHGHCSRSWVALSYSSWRSMKSRCTNPKSVSWRHYGGRGIKVCERWLKFENFLDDMGERPKGLSLDRKDNDGNYEPGNCRWATLREQNNNNRHCHLLTFNGITQNIRAWSKELGISEHKLYWRVSRAGWTTEKAFTYAGRAHLKGK